VSAELQRIEQIIDASGVARPLELRLPVGVRPRQLSVRTLLTGMLLTAVHGRPAHLRRVHHALLHLDGADQHRLAIITQWRTGPHLLTYRQLERTFGLLCRALAKDTPDGTPSETLSDVLDALLEASVTGLGEPASASYAVDWTDHETWSRPPPKPRAERPDPPTADPEQPTPDNHNHNHNHNDNDNGDGDGDGDDDRRCADPEASWGHRRGNHPGQKDELFHGYYLQAVTIVKDEHGPPVPELARRMQLTSCRLDPPAALVPVLQRMSSSGVTIGDLLADSGYAYRVPETWALPVRALGAELIVDLHPNDRGPHATHHGAVCANGNLYCPATPRPLLDIRPLPRAATPEQTDAHDQQCSELAKYKLSAITRHDPDGYHRVICPAAQGKLRCPLRPASQTLPHDRPTILTPPEHPPACCQQQTITIPPAVNAKTAQKHDYPSPEHRRSYARRSAAERTFSTVKDSATNDISRGWCRIMGLTPIALFTATVLIARNLRIHDAFHARQAADAQRAADSLPPKQRTRRRQSTQDLIDTAGASP
jgi:hypothetical protein